MCKKNLLFLDAGKHMFGLISPAKLLSISLSTFIQEGIVGNYIIHLSEKGPRPSFSATVMSWIATEQCSSATLVRQVVTKRP